MVDSGQQTTALPAYKRALRIAAIGVPVGIGLFAFLFVFAIGGMRGGWLWATLVTTPVGAVLGWFGWGPAGGRRAATAVVALLGLAFGLWMSANAILTTGRLRADMDSITMPAGFERGGDDPGGSNICFDVCNDLSRSWRATGTPEEVTVTVAARLRSQGFDLRPFARGGADPDTTMYGHRGRLGIHLHVREPRAQDGSAAGNGVVVEITLDTFTGYLD